MSPTAATLGMEQLPPAVQGGPRLYVGMVEISLMGNADDNLLIQQIEALAIAQGGILHWGQSNGHLTAQDVTDRFPTLNAWKSIQKKLGGTTFTNLLMKRCGLA